MLGASEPSMTLPPKRCPECGEEYVHTVLVCADCGVALVLAGEPSPRRELPPVSELVCVRTATRSWAHNFSELLAETGIGHRVDVAADAGRGAGFAPGAELCSVFVRAEDAEEAARLDARYLHSQIPDVPEDYASRASEADQCPACAEPADLSAPECPSCGLAFRDAE